jgi:heme exporter protein D
MDIRMQIAGTVFLLFLLGLLIVAYIRQHKTLKEMKRSQKAREDQLEKVSEMQSTKA